MLLKDVIHYYIGQECQTPEGVAAIRSVGQWHPGDDVFVHFNKYSTISGGKYYNLSKHEIRPILRRIEDLTEDEARQIADMIYRDIFNEPGQFLHIQQVTTDNSDATGFTMEDVYGDAIGLTIDASRGIEFSNKGDMMNVRQFDVTHYLLSIGIDLFGLIDSGQAIDRKKLDKN